MASLVKQLSHRKEIGMFTGLTEDDCCTAWAIVKSSIIEANILGVTDKLAGTITVLDPWSGDVLFKDRINDRIDNPELYDEISQAKAMVSWETGKPSRDVQQSAPHLYRPGMTKWGGSVIQDKLVVSFSGVQAVFDEAIAKSMLAWIIALCQHEMTKEDGVMDNDSSFLLTDEAMEAETREEADRLDPRREDAPVPPFLKAPPPQPRRPRD